MGPSASPSGAYSPPLPLSPRLLLVIVCASRLLLASPSERSGARSQFNSEPLQFTVGGQTGEAAVTLSAGGTMFSLLNNRKGDLLLLENGTVGISLKTISGEDAALSTNLPTNISQMHRKRDWHPRGDGFVSFENFLALESVARPAIPLVEMLDVSANNVLLETDRRINIGGMRQWSLWVHQDFQEFDHGWRLTSNHSTHRTLENVRQSCQTTSNDLFFGGYCSLAGNKVHNTIHEIPPGKLIKIKVRMHLFDKWIGEQLYLKVNDQVVWTYSHSHCSKIFSEFCNDLNVCGDERYGDELSHTLEVVLPHTGITELKMEFGSTLKGDPCVASWGFDDVMVFVI